MKMIIKIVLCLILALLLGYLFLHSSFKNRMMKVGVINQKKAVEFKEINQICIDSAKEGEVFRFESLKKFNTELYRIENNSENGTEKFIYFMLPIGDLVVNSLITIDGKTNIVKSKRCYTEGPVIERRVPGVKPN